MKEKIKKLLDLIIELEGVSVNENKRRKIINLAQKLKSDLENGDEKLKFMVCNCFSEVLLVEKDRYSNDDNYDFWFAIYYNYQEKPSIWRRLKFAIMHIKTGKMYNDQINLSKENVKELTEWMIRNQ